MYETFIHKNSPAFAGAPVPVEFSCLMSSTGESKRRFENYQGLFSPISLRSHGSFRSSEIEGGPDASPSGITATCRAQKSIRAKFDDRGVYIQVRSSLPFDLQIESLPEKAFAICVAGDDWNAGRLIETVRVFSRHRTSTPAMNARSLRGWICTYG